MIDHPALFPEFIHFFTRFTNSIHYNHNNLLLFINLDYVYLWLSCANKSKYYIQIEDDIIAKAGYMEFINKTIISNVDVKPKWFILQFSSLGFIGKLFRSSALNVNYFELDILDLVIFQSLAEFVLLFWKEKPVDWLLEDLLVTKVCNPEKDPKSCQTEKTKIKKNIVPAQFQHVGVYSSLSGKIQKLKDASFSEKRKRAVKATPNQPAIFKPNDFFIPPMNKVYTNITAYQTHTLENFVLKKQSFWGENPTNGKYSPVVTDYILL